MNEPLLSILIPTTADRKYYLNRLLSRIESQRMGLSDVEILISDDERLTTGAKRNALQQRASGFYSVHIDDDDLIPDYYLPEVLMLAEMNRDTIGYYVQYLLNGIANGTAKYSFQCRTYARDYSPQREPIYLRPSSHITPIRTEIAKSVKFPDKSQGEDDEWSMQVLPRLQSEVFCPLYMYFYYVRSNKSIIETDAMIYGREEQVDTWHHAPTWENAVAYYEESDRLFALSSD